MTRRASVALAAVAVVALSGTAWKSLPAMEADAELPAARKPLQVQTLQVQRVDGYARLRSYTGILREARRSQVSFERSGKVVQMFVDEGAYVENGQQLARLENRHIVAREAQTAAQLAEADARLDELLGGPRAETIAAKQAELAALQAKATVLEKQLNRRKQALKTASVSHEEYDVFFYDFQAAQAMADVAQRQLDELLAGTREEQIAAQRARKAQLEAQLQDVRFDLQDAVLLAPFAGRISHRFTDEGTVVTAGTPVLELIDEEHLEAWIGLPTAASESIRVGDRRTVTVANRPCDAEVRAMAPDVDRDTRTRDVILKLADDATGVYPGQVVRIDVEQHVDESGYWLPTTALTRGARGLWSLYVVQEEAREETIARRDVELLDTVGERSFLRGTLQEGDRVVVSGVHKIVVGQRVDAAEQVAEAVIAARSDAATDH